MSKGSTPVKVLRTALKRVQKGWTKSSWHRFEAGPDGGKGKNFVCLEGAIYGYCDGTQHEVTEAQRQAISIVKGIINERDPRFHSIPEFNDDVETELDDILEVIKLGIIRCETGGIEEEISDEDFDDLLEFMDKE